MESRLNRLIRELLKRFGIKTDKVIDRWNLIGHFKNLFEKELKKQRIEVARKIISLTEMTDEEMERIENEYGFKLGSDNYLKEKGLK